MEEVLGQNSVPPPGSIDRSKILDIKPLRSLIPVYPPQSSQTDQYPPGFSSFFPFGAPQQSTPAGFTPRAPAMPAAPIRAFRRPIGAEDIVSPTMEGLNDPDTSGKKKRRGRPRLTEKKKQKSNGPDFDSSAAVVGISISSEQRGDGSPEVVNLVLTMFDALRRRLSQLEDAKELSTGSVKRPDLKACKLLMTKGIRTNMKKRLGTVPGVEIGDIFFFRMELCLVGLHAPSMGGIDALNLSGEFEEETVATSIVSSGEYEDEAEDSDVLIYTGQGGNFNGKDRAVTDQKLQRGNLALERSSRQQNEVRVIRGMRDGVNPNAKIYIYDGLYKIQDSWVEKGKNGGGVFKYKLVRVPGQASAFGVWKSIQKWKSGSPSRNGLILADLSSGAEKIPVSLVNDVDSTKAPAYFTYFHSLRHPKSFTLMQNSHGCNCTKCVPGDLNCSCIRRNEGDFPYSTNGVLVSRKPLVHECGPTCQCFPNCKNRISQTGLKHHMEVFKTKDRGWGLRSLDPIRAGTFICEYAGEVLDRNRISQLMKEDSDEYVFDTTRIYDPFKWNYEPGLLGEVSTNDSSEDYAVPYPLVISAKNVGNVARFMNHSCSPNVFWQPVMYEENNQSFLHIAFFARRHIPPMMELTYDYGSARSGHAEGSSARKGGKKCLCRSSNCRGSFG